MKTNEILIKDLMALVNIGKPFKRTTGVERAIAVARHEGNVALALRANELAPLPKWHPNNNPLSAMLRF